MKITDKMTGQAKRQAQDRLVELVLYVGAKCGLDEHYGALKLNKILFYSDFRAYRVLGEPISGAEYRKYPHGPAPAVMGPLRAALHKKQDAFEYMNPLHGIVDGDGEAMSEKRLLPRRKPNMELFSREQIMILDEVIAQLRPLNGQQVSRMSHDHPGWRLADMDETIPYEAELLPKQQQLLSAKARKWAVTVARRFEDARLPAESAAS